MPSSLITERTLARSLKKLMLTVPLNRITIKRLVDDCGVTRHTFYNHFQDIYELLGFLYNEEVIENLDGYRNYAGWKQGYLMVLRYIQANKTVCLNTFHSLGHEHLEQFLYDVILGVMNGVVADVAADMTVDENSRELVADFYTRAILAQTTKWLKSGAKTEPQALVELVDRIIGGLIHRSLERFAPPPAQSP